MKYIMQKCGSLETDILEKSLNHSRRKTLPSTGIFRMKKNFDTYKNEDFPFYGLFSNKKKNKLWNRSNIIFVPAVREGWGQVVTEANAMGTPAIGYHVLGLRDSIRHGETGITIIEKTPA